jgi:hypothetical protein
MGKLLLHPNHPLWSGGPHPRCPVCRREILPLTPVVEVPEVIDGILMVMYLHEECK